MLNIGYEHRRKPICFTASSSEIPEVRPQTKYRAYNVRSKYKARANREDWFLCLRIILLIIARPNVIDRIGIMIIVLYATLWWCAIVIACESAERCIVCSVRCPMRKMGLAKELFLHSKPIRSSCRMRGLVVYFGATFTHFVKEKLMKKNE